jgi:hypothetical protein
MTPEKIRTYREALGGNRFLLTVGAGVVDTVLLVAGYLDKPTYSNLTLWTVGAFIAGAAAVDISNRNRGPFNDPTRPA